MKKLLAVLLALCVIGGAAFAQITFTGHAKAKVTYNANAFAYADEFRFNVAGTSEDKNFGYRGRFQVTSSPSSTTYYFADNTLQTSAGATDTNTTQDTITVVKDCLSVSYAYGYAKFFDGLLTVTAGKLYDFSFFMGQNLSNNQTGNVSVGLGWGYAAKGFLLSLKPVDGLNIEALYKPSGSLGIEDLGFGASYDIADVGSLFAYYSTGTLSGATELGVAFNLSAVENLTFGIGYNGYASHQIAAVIGYTADALYVEVAPMYTVGGQIYVEGGVEYSLENGMAIRAFGGYDTTGDTLGATYIGGGELNIPMGKGECNIGVNYTDADGLTIPVYCKYAF